ncbi:MAG TPA: hypothetical protein PKN50_13630, partial [Spirochaetota bacterium]|nr:hypothetical protein [Spirochaetota bacterium]
MKYSVLMSVLLLCAAGQAAPALPVSVRGPVSDFVQTQLNAVEKVSTREISGIIRGILSETDDAKKQELVKKLRSYPQAEVGDCWLELLDGAVRVSTTVRIIDNMSEFSDRRFVLPLANLLVSSHHAVRK